MAVIGLFAILVGVATLVGFASILKKAGQPMWVLFIPIYGQVVLARVAGFSVAQSEILTLLMVIPLLNFILYIVLMERLARSFGRGGFFAAGLVFLPPVFACILGLGLSLIHI